MSSLEKAFYSNLIYSFGYLIFIHHNIQINDSFQLNYFLIMELIAVGGVIGHLCKRRINGGFMVYFVDDPCSKWELQISTHFESITITAHKGAFRLNPFCIWVNPPNFIERFLGITFEQKVEKAKKKAQLKIDKLNAEIERANELAGVKPFDLSNPPQGGSGLPSRPPTQQHDKVEIPEECRFESVGL